jgi:hypothetical protein
MYTIHQEGPYQERGALDMNFLVVMSGYEGLLQVAEQFVLLDAGPVI